MENVYHQLNDQGYYLFSFTPDESPREPGVYLIPAGCVNAPLPEYDPAKYLPLYKETGWELVALQVPKKSWFRKIFSK